MSVVSMKDLLEAGVHFGHQTRRWNPKMRRYIFTERNGIYIIDLRKTLAGIDEGYRFVKDVVAGGGVILFVSTKKQISETVEQEAVRCGMPFVNFRWLGGMLTNFQTIHKRILRLRELETQQAQGGFDELTKKEALKLTHEYDKLRRTLTGIKDLNRVPEAVFVVDTHKEEICIKEARKLGIPIVAVVDTNCDPDEVSYVIPGNDDAIRSGALLSKVVADAVLEGLENRPPEVIAAVQAAEASGVQLTAGTEEPPAEWELMLVQQEAEGEPSDIVAESGPAAAADQPEPPVAPPATADEESEEAVGGQSRDDDVEAPAK